MISVSEVSGNRQSAPGGLPSSGGTISGATATTTSIVIITYKRPESLARCLEGLAKQSIEPTETIVVVREEDEATITLLRSYPRVKVITVTETGHAAARNAGKDAASSDIISMIDDDAVPRPDWLSRVVENFDRDPRLCALSGRDQCYVEGRPIPPSEVPVGRLLWYGKHMGNHHLGKHKGPVDIIKGVNLSFRRALTSRLHFDRRLRARGGAEDFAFSRSIALAGMPMTYDPEVVVDHYEAKDHLRHYGSLQVTGLQGLEDHNYNMVIATWPSLSFAGRLASALYFLVLGTRVSPGIAQAIRFFPTLRLGSLRRFVRAQRGRFKAMFAMMFSLQANALPTRAATGASGAAERF